MRLVWILHIFTYLMCVAGDVRHERSSSGTFQGLIKVNDNIYVAVGYALGNVIMVIAHEGLIIVDTTESMVAARKIKDELRKVSTAPIKAIIYTHHHMDHIGGAKAFVEDPDNPPVILAHHLLVAENEAYFTYAAKARFIRMVRQFGVFAQNSSNTIEFGKDDDEYGTVYPNTLMYKNEENFTIAGLHLTLVRLEGETVDHIGVWIPSMQTFMPGDTYYASFPNVYSIRGVPVRNPVAWYKSLDRMIAFEPEILVPSHKEPMYGKQTIRDALIPYRDAVQYMHDQAVRYINRGLSPDEVAKKVKFPESLQNLEVLREEYGRVDWSVKGVFQLYLGWFSGNAEDLLPLSISERAVGIVTLAGGVDKLARQARIEAIKGKTQWALELASHVLEVAPLNTHAIETKVKALNDLADIQINTNAQNYLRTAALEASGELNLSLMSHKGAMKSLGGLDIHCTFDILPMAFKPEQCGNNKNVTMNIYFPNEMFSLQVRNSVLVVSKNKPIHDARFRIVTTENVFRHTLVTKTKDHIIVKASEKNPQYDVVFLFFKICFEDL